MCHSGYFRVSKFYRPFANEKIHCWKIVCVQVRNIAVDQRTWSSRVRPSALELNLLKIEADELCFIYPSDLFAIASQTSSYFWNHIMLLACDQKFDCLWYLVFYSSQLPVCFVFILFETNKRFSSNTNLCRLWALFWKITNFRTIFLQASPNQQNLEPEITWIATNTCDLAN